MFSVKYRDQVRDEVLRLASSDPRVVAGAAVGSLARGAGDRWSDLDLTFAVADRTQRSEVLEDWTRYIKDIFRATHLFDVPSGSAIYRVFLLPDCLQLDLSFAPASEFGAAGPEFRLLFGRAVDKPPPRPVSAAELFGYAVHHALRARISIERRRYWQAEYWISGVRDYALSLTCQTRNLPARQARGFDDLPCEVRSRFLGALVGSLDRDALLGALSCAIDGLMLEAHAVPELAKQVEPELRKLQLPWH